MVALIALALISGVVAAVLWTGRGAHEPLPDVVVREESEAILAAYAAGARWTRCVAQDPQSLAQTARRKLG